VLRGPAADALRRSDHAVAEAHFEAALNDTRAAMPKKLKSPRKPAPTTRLKNASMR